MNTRLEAGNGSSETLIRRAIIRIAKRVLEVPFLLTAAQRSLPDFVIIGAQRCGTTSLYLNVARHPCVVPSFWKEVKFFDMNFYRGVRWYRAHFPFETKLRRLTQQDQPAIAGESTPYYMFHPAVPFRMAKVLPHGKFIVILRNPVDRAYSHYKRNVLLGFEKETFARAIELEEERLRGQAERLLRDDRYRSFNHVTYSYASRGRYVEQLRTWLGVFPREQFLILKSEDFFAKPDVVLRRVWSFLGLPCPEFDAYPRFREPSYEPPDKAVRRKLEEYFQPFNRELAQYFGDGYEWA